MATVASVLANVCSPVSRTELVALAKAFEAAQLYCDMHEVCLAMVLVDAWLSAEERALLLVSFDHVMQKERHTLAVLHDNEAKLNQLEHWAAVRAVGTEAPDVPAGSPLPSDEGTDGGRSAVPVDSATARDARSSSLSIDLNVLSRPTSRPSSAKAANRVGVTRTSTPSIADSPDLGHRPTNDDTTIQGNSIGSPTNTVPPWDACDFAVKVFRLRTSCRIDRALDGAPSATNESLPHQETSVSGANRDGNRTSQLSCDSSSVATSLGAAMRRTDSLTHLDILSEGQQTPQGGHAALSHGLSAAAGSGTSPVSHTGRIAVGGDVLRALDSGAMTPAAGQRYGPAHARLGEGDAQRERLRDDSVEELVLRWHQASAALCLGEIRVAKQFIQELIGAAREQLTLLCYRAMTLIVDMLLPAAAARPREVSIYYRKWMLEIYRTLYELDLLSEFNEMLRKGSQQILGDHAGYPSGSTQRNSPSPLGSNESFWSPTTTDTSTSQRAGMRRSASSKVFRNQRRELLDDLQSSFPTPPRSATLPRSSFNTLSSTTTATEGELGTGNDFGEASEVADEQSSPYRSIGRHMSLLMGTDFTRQRKPVNAMGDCAVSSTASQGSEDQRRSTASRSHCLPSETVSHVSREADGCRLGGNSTTDPSSPATAAAQHVHVNTDPRSIVRSAQSRVMGMLVRSLDERVLPTGAAGDSALGAAAATFGVSVTSAFPTMVAPHTATAEAAANAPRAAGLRDASQPARTSLFAQAQAHHHFFQYPTVHSWSDLHAQFSDLLRDTQTYLSVHNPIAAVVVNSFADFLSGVIPDERREVDERATYFTRASAAGSNLTSAGTVRAAEEKQILDKGGKKGARRSQGAKGRSTLVPKTATVPPDADRSPTAGSSAHTSPSTPSSPAPEPGTLLAAHAYGPQSLETSANLRLGAAVAMIDAYLADVECERITTPAFSHAQTVSSGGLTPPASGPPRAGMVTKAAAAPASTSSVFSVSTAAGKRSAPSGSPSLPSPDAAASASTAVTAQSSQPAIPQQLQHQQPVQPSGSGLPSTPIHSKSAAGSSSATVTGVASVPLNIPSWSSKEEKERFILVLRFLKSTRNAALRAMDQRISTVES